MVSLFTPFTPIDIMYRRYTASFDASGNNLSLNRNFYFGQERSEIESIITLAEPIMDITSEVGPEIIQKYNLKMAETILIKENEDTKIYEELEKIPSVIYSSGGSAENTMRVLSWCLNMEPLERNRFRVSMLGSVGDDEYKNRIEKELKNIGVNPIFEVIKGDKTTRCGVCIYNKEKFFATQIRASKKLTEKFIDEHLDEILSHKILFIEGYMVSNKFDLCKKLCNHFIQDKKLIVLSLSAVFVIKNYYDKMLELANEADLIIGNMEEAVELAGNKPEMVESIFEIIFEKLKPKENRLIVITDGPNGAYWAKYSYEEKKLEHFIQYFAYELKDEEIQDLNGTGDAFLGGFLSRYMKGYSVHDCCRIGIEAATIILKNVGCTFPATLNILKDYEK